MKRRVWMLLYALLLLVCAGLSLSAIMASRRASATNALVKAITERNPAGVEAALAAGADPNALQSTVPQNFLQRLVGMLRPYGPPPEPYLAYSLTNNALFYSGVAAVENQQRGPDPKDLEITRILLKHKANPNLKGEFGANALHWACQAQKPDLALMLLEAGADPKLTTEKGLTVLHCAAGGGNLTMTRYFLDKGFDPNATAPGLANITPLHWLAAEIDRKPAAQQPDVIECARLLIQKGADPRRLNAEGRSPAQLTRRPDLLRVFAQSK